MAKKWKIAALVVVILISGIYLSLRSGLLTEPFRRIVLRPLTRQIPWPVTVGRVSVNFLPSAVVFSDVSILESKDSPRPLVDIKEIRINFSPWSLLTEVTIINKVRLTEPRFHLDNLQAGPSASQWPPEWFQGGTEGPLRKPAVVVVRQFQIRDGSLRLGRESEKWMIGLEHFDAEVVPSLDMKSFQVHLLTDGAEVRSRDFEKRLDRAELSFFATADAIRIQEATFESGDSRLAGSGRIKDAASPEYNGTIDASFPLSELRPFVPSVRDLGGRSHITGSVSGRGLAYSVSGEASLTELTWNGHPIGQMGTGFEFKDKTLSLSRFDASVFKGTVRGGGDIRLASTPPEYRLSLELDGISAKRLARLAGLKTVLTDYALDGKLDITGRGTIRESLTGNGTFDLKLPPGFQKPDSPPENWVAWANRLERIGGSFRIEKGAVYLESGTVVSENSSLNGTGSLLADGTVAADFQMTSREVHEFTPLMKLEIVSGAAEITGKMTGTLKEPTVLAEGNLKEATIKGSRFDSVSGRIEFRYPRLDFHSGRFVSADSQYDLDGFLSFDPSYPARPYFNFMAGIRKGRPGEIVALFYRELPITITAEGDIRAEGNPREFSVTGRLTTGPGAIYTQEIDAGELDLTVTRNEVSFKRVTATRGSTTVTGEGSIQYAGQFELQANTTNGHLEDVDWVRSHWDGISASVSGEFRGGGQLKNPEFHGTLNLNDIRYRDRAYGNGNLTGSVADEKLAFTSDLDNGLSFKGNLIFSADLPFDLQVGLNQFQAKPVLDLLNIPRLSDNDDLSAVGSGILTANGTLKDLKNSVVTLQLKPLILKIGPVSMSNPEDILVEMSGGAVEVRSLQLAGEGISLAVTGGFEIQKSFHLSIKGEGNLSLLSTLSEDISLAHGKTFAAVQIQEAWNDPTILGKVSVQDGRLISQTVGQLLILDTMEMSFSKKQVVLDSFEGRLGGGNISANGRWELDGLKVARFGVNLDIRSVRLAPITGFSSIVDASLLYAGEGDSDWINGTVSVQRASYERLLDWKTLAVELHKRERSNSQGNSRLLETKLNLQVTGKKNILINNNMAKVPFEIDLLVKGTVGQPVLLGRLEASGGTVFFRHNEFKITSASIDFIDPDRIRPIFDIHATSRIRDYLVNLSLIGPADRFDLTLSSDPPLGDHEILALLTFGKEPEEIDQASMEIIGATEAVDLLTGELQVAVEEKVKTLTGIDRIQVDPYYSSNKSASTARVTVSKRLWEDSLFVTYATTMDASGEDIIQMEYIINDNVSLVGERDEVGIVGGDLKFRFEFR